MALRAYFFYNLTYYCLNKVLSTDGLTENTAKIQEEIRF